VIQLAEGAVIAAFLAFCRVGSCFMLMPGLSSARVPMQVRLFVAVAVTGALLATVWDSILPHVSREPALLVPLVVSEILTGAMLGLLARFYMMALQFMGSAIAMLIGFGGMGGPGIENGEPSAPLGEIISFSALMLLFVFDFHYEIVRALVRSYEIAPITPSFDARGALVSLTDTIGEAFLIVLRLGSPFVAYDLLVNLTIGFVNKLVPQIPVYFISLPMVLAGGLILFYFGVATMLSLFADGFFAAALGR
jgi:flagellar biosynthetic protein FliR